MSLQSYRQDLLHEVNSVYLDPGEEAKLRGTLGCIDEWELAHDRVTKITAPIVIPMPVDVVPAVEVIDLDDPNDEIADPSAVA